MILGTSVRIAATAFLALFLAADIGAQSSADYQALRKELDLMRQRLAELQKEVDALKAARGTAPVDNAPATGTAIVPMTNVVLNLSRAPIRGAVSAKVAMVEVSDFECPFCGRYARDTAPAIKKQYVDTNRIAYAFIHMPIATHAFAFKASEAAACAGDQGRFWEMHDLLFARQGTALAPAYLPGKGDTLGLEKAAYTSCLTTSKHAAYIKADVAQLQQYPRTGTPTFYIGSLDPATKMFRSAVRIVGAKSFAIFQQALDEQLTRAKSATAH